jgi:hypothetical protein
MFGSNILDVAIGVIFIYLFISLICTAINEAIASLTNKRGTNLFEGIKNLLNDPEFTGLAQQLYNHGLVDGISRNATDPAKPNRLPSYMPPAHFSLALLDILGTRGVVAAAHGDLLTAVEEADSACRQAQTAAAANPADPMLQQAMDRAKRDQEATELALKTAADNAAITRDAAAQAASIAPGNQDLARAAAEAKDAADTARAAVKMLEAKRAAIALAHDPKNADLIQSASDTLERALAAVRNFAAKSPDPLGNIQQAVDRLPGGHTKECLHVLIDKTRREAGTTKQHLEVLQKNIEGWFNDSMARVGGWYKRWTQRVLIVVAIVVVIGANADGVKLVRRLATDGALRSALVTAAEDAAKSATSQAASKNDTREGTSLKPNVTLAIDPIRQLERQAATIELPLGLDEWARDWKEWNESDSPWVRSTTPLSKLFGLVISVFAVSLGAPFWFDTLSTVVNIRGTGTPPGDSKKGASQPK